MNQSVTTQVQKDMTLFLGKDAIRELHKPNYYIDIIAIISLPVLAGIVGYLLATCHFSPLWIMLFIIQGFIFQGFFLLSHELFIHRRIGGEKIAYLGSLLFMIPIMTSPSAYKEVHWIHHYYLNTEKDSEVIALKQIKDTRLTRILYGTIWGLIVGHKYLIQAKENKKIHRQLTFESVLVSLWGLLVVVLAFIWKPIIYAYILPICIMLPIINVCRFILEHVDADPEHPETGQFATFYRTNFFTRLIFLGDSGDCHLIHHIFWRIPFYRMPKAIALMHPYLMKIGVNEHRSYLKLLYGYYVRVLPQRRPWKNKL